MLPRLIPSRGPSGERYSQVMMILCCSAALKGYLYKYFGAGSRAEHSGHGAAGESAKATEAVLRSGATGETHSARGVSPPRLCWLAHSQQRAWRMHSAPGQTLTGKRRRVRTPGQRQETHVTLAGRGRSGLVGHPSGGHCATKTRTGNILGTPERYSGTVFRTNQRSEGGKTTHTHTKQRCTHCGQPQPRPPSARTRRRTRRRGQTRQRPEGRPAP